jgi:hypothetical protein
VNGRFNKRILSTAYYVLIKKLWAIKKGLDLHLKPLFI